MAHDPKHWFDPTNTEPHFIAWQPLDGLDWMREQLERAARESTPDTDEHATIRQWIARYDPAALRPVTGADAPFWDRQHNTLRHGRWTMLPIFIGHGRKLVLQIVCHADRDQSGTTATGRTYPVCRNHARPADKPYQGSDHSSTAHPQARPHGHTTA